MNMVNWFEIPVDDLNRAKNFYQQVFSCEFQNMQMGDAEMETFPYKEGEEGSSGCLIKSPAYLPSKTGALVYFHVEDIDSTLSKVKAAGGEVSVPPMPIGEHGFIAHFIDSEGNRIALHAVK